MKAQTGNLDEAFLGSLWPDGEQGWGGSRDETAPALEGREGYVQAAGSRAGLGGLSTPSVGYSAWRMRSGLVLLWTPCFSPCSSEVAIRFFGLFVSYCL